MSMIPSAARRIAAVALAVSLVGTPMITGMLGPAGLDASTSGVIGTAAAASSNDDHYPIAQLFTTATELTNLHDSANVSLEGSGDSAYVAYNVSKTHAFYEGAEEDAAGTGEGIGGYYLNMTYDGKFKVVVKGNKSGTWEVIDRRTFGPTSDGSVNQYRDIYIRNTSVDGADEFAAYDGLRINVSTGNKTDSDKLHLQAWGITAQPDRPNVVLDDPLNNETIKESHDFVTLLGDNDLSRSYDDAVDIRIRVRKQGNTGDGIQVNSTTAQSEGSVSLGQSLNPGLYEWKAIAEDRFGHTDATGWEPFGRSGVITLRDELDTSQLSSKVTLTVIGVESKNTTTRTTSDGTVSLEGLPEGEQFVVLLKDDSNDYYARRTIMRGIFEDHRMWVLPTSADAATIVYRLVDQTGQYPAKETRLYVEKVITYNGKTTFRRIAGGIFGASDEIVLVLEDRVKYRLVVENAEGNKRVLGGYTHGEK